MKKKILLTSLFILSILPMLLNQYGGMRGVQEISGLMNLYNPIGIISVILYFVGIWLSFNKTIINKILALLGTIGIVISEIYTFFTWHILTVTGELSLIHSIDLAFPEFYFGLIMSIAMIVIYCVCNLRKKRVKGRGL